MGFWATNDNGNGNNDMKLRMTFCMCVKSLDFAWQHAELTD